MTSFHKPITVDGEFRPLITVNSQMPGSTIIARENQMLQIKAFPNGTHWYHAHSGLMEYMVH